MATSLANIRFKVEQEIEDTLINELVINWSNIAQSEFMLRIFVPGSTTLAITTADLTYALPSDVREIRRIRRQSDLDNGINRPYNPVYTFYNGNFEVPTAFTSADTLLIDYYAFLTFFTDIEDEIDLDDRFFPLYTSYIKAMYFQMPTTIANIGPERADQKFSENMTMHYIV